MTRPLLPLAAALLPLLLAASAGAEPVTRTFSFIAEGFEPPAGQEPVTGSVTVTTDLQGALREGPVEAIDLVIGDIVYTPAHTTYVYDPAVDRLSVRGDAEGKGPGSFEFEVRKTSTAGPGPNDFVFFGRDGGYHVAKSVKVMPAVR